MQSARFDAGPICLDAAAQMDARKRAALALLARMARAKGVEPSSAARGCGSAVELCPHRHGINEHNRLHHPFEGRQVFIAAELVTM